eukprot:1839521-Rhodomonas_salina.2
MQPSAWQERPAQLDVEATLHRGVIVVEPLVVLGGGSNTLLSVRPTQSSPAARSARSRSARASVCQTRPSRSESARRCE